MLENAYRPRVLLNARVDQTLDCNRPHALFVLANSDPENLSANRPTLGRAS